MKRILIIDDDEGFSDFLKINLELRGDYECMVASGGEEGLKMANDNNLDLILLDIMMPGIDGFEVLKRLKANDKTKNIPVIMLTAKGDDDSMIKALKLHDDGYIMKPLKIEELEEKIEDLLGGMTE